MNLNLTSRCLGMMLLASAAASFAQAPQGKLFVGTDAGVFAGAAATPARAASGSVPSGPRFQGGVTVSAQAAPARPGDLQAAGACPPVAAASGSGVNHGATVLPWARASGPSASGCEAGSGPGGGPRVTVLDGAATGK